jgi:beta-lactamase class A
MRKAARFGFYTGPVVGAGLPLAAAVAAIAAGCSSHGSSPWEARLRATEGYMGNRQGIPHIALVAGGRSYGWRSLASVPAASTVKPFLMVAYLDQPAVRNRSLTQDEQDLLMQMVGGSNNAATAVIHGRLGPRWLRAEKRKFGLSHLQIPPTDWGAAQTTAAEQAYFFSNMLLEIPPRHRAFAQAALASSPPEQQWGILQARPPGWTVLSKNGWGSPNGEFAASVGLFIHGPRRVALAIYVTASPSRDYAQETIAGLAQRIMRPGPGVTSQPLACHASRATMRPRDDIA